MTDHDWLDDHVELYAIDSLPTDERGRVHDELAKLSAGERNTYDERIVGTRETMADYASRFAVTAPDGMRARVLADFSDRADPEREARRSVTPIRSVSRRRRIGAALAAAALVIAVALGAGVFIGRATAPISHSTQADAVDAVLAAPDATVSRGALSEPRGTLFVVSSRTRNQAVALLRGLAGPLPSDRSLQVWLVGTGSTPVSAGVVDSDVAPALLVGPVDGATGLAVTLEPRGGSPAPTTPILAQVPF